MKARDHIDCGRCGGTGKVSLPHELAETLSFVRARGTVTSSDVLRELMRDGQGGTAAVNRLEKLRALGLVVRHSMRGRAWLYMAPMKRKNQSTGDQ